MKTRIACFAEKLIESGWLVALVVVPLLFNSYTERGFEEDKLPFLRSIAVVLTVAVMVWAAERGREVFYEQGRPLWRAPLVLPWALTIGVYILATVFSVAPAVSFWGDYVRRQGTYTHLSYMLFFILILLTLRSSKQINRMLTVIAVTSFPIACYGIIQHFGMDPIVWTGADFENRVPSTAGNPIFLAAYLCMVVPLTLARVIEHVSHVLAMRRETVPVPGYAASCVSAGAYLLLLGVQLLAVLYSESRGPVVGLLGGLFVFTILFALQHGTRIRRVTFIILFAGVVGTLAIIALARIPQSPLKSVPYLDRLSTVLETESGSGKVRILIWEGVAKLLKENPKRLIFGYGPETLYLMFRPYYPPELGHYEDPNKLPDRSHNETFDSLVMLGAMGLAVQLLLFGSVFYFILKWLGLIDTRRRGHLFISLCVIGVLSGLLFPTFVLDRLSHAAIGIPTGLVAAFALYLLYRAITFPGTRSIVHPHSLLLTALLSAIVGHFIEIQVGIANSLTLLCFWIFAALSVVAGMPLLRPDAEEAVPASLSIPEAPVRRRKKIKDKDKDKKKEIPEPPSPAYARSRTLWCLALMMCLVPAVLIFDFIVPDFRITERTSPVVFLYALTWLFGGILISSEVAVEEARPGSGLLRNFGIYASISLTLCLVYLLFHTHWVQMKAPFGGVTSAQLLIELEAHRANTLTILYVWAFMIMAGSALLLKPGNIALPRFTRYLPLPFVYATALFLILPFIVSTNLDISLADAYQKRAQACIKLNKWDGAIILFKRAIAVQPRQDAYYLKLADAYLLKAQADPQQQQDLLMQEGIAQLKRALEINPLDAKYIQRTAKMHYSWAQLPGDPGARARQLDLSDQIYSEAIKRFPNSVVIWNEWARVAIDQREWRKAIERINQSLVVDPIYAPTYGLLGFYYLEQKDWRSARDACFKAATLQPGNIDHWSSLALALTHLGEMTQAIDANLKVLKIKPDDSITYCNLALLYFQTGNMDRALDSAERALKLAPPKEKPGIEQWIKEIKEQQARVPMIR